MAFDDIKRVAVIGGDGQMGRQIGLNTAFHGIETNMYVMDDICMENAIKWIDQYINGRIAKGKITAEEAKLVLDRVHVMTSLKKAVEDADLVIEAIVEDKNIKEGLFKQLDEYAREDAILTTNSSRMVSSMFTNVVRNPSRLANLHYFNPALVMKLTEVVQGEHTSEDTVLKLIEFSNKTGKKPIWVKKEIEGFIVNRILRAITNEALYLLEEGIATPEDIDLAAEFGLNHPMGPFKLMDFSGLDTCYLVARDLMEETGFKKPGIDLLKEKYLSKEWGRKTGRGWYDYSAQ